LRVNSLATKKVLHRGIGEGQDGKVEAAEKGSLFLDEVGSFLHRHR